MIRLPVSPRPSRPAIARAGLALPVALLLAGLVPGGAGALVHDRLPADDLGGSTALPIAAPIGEDARTPVHGGGPAAPGAADGSDAAANG